ncbi:hypothetical protein [Sinorhizobium sp. BG8]|uniref:hypothetical protein n=1 Tax=Sinorhizobium sp. BG8 TaxID=2613773 RepID=UPI001FEDA505|nr:hypothetical protein [Sinorhizobium sp. BG8]
MPAKTGEQAATDVAAQGVQAGTMTTHSAAANTAAASAQNVPMQDPDIAAGEEATGDRAGLVMQPTALNAGQASIFSTAGASNQEAAQSEDRATGPSTNPAMSSIYSNSNAGQNGSAGRTLPVESMPHQDTSVDGGLPDDVSTEQTYSIPDKVPLPTSAQTALVAPVDTADASKLMTVAEPSAVPSDEGDASQGPADTAGKALTLAALFASKRKNQNQFEGRTAAEKPKPRINRDNAAQIQQASANYESLPGVDTGTTNSASHIPKLRLTPPTRAGTSSPKSLHSQGLPVSPRTVCGFRPRRSRPAASSRSFSRC